MVFKVKKVKGFTSKDRGEVFPSGWGVTDQYGNLFKITKLKLDAEKYARMGNKKLKLGRWI